jgi:hypothetical protein
LEGLAGHPKFTGRLGIARVIDFGIAGFQISKGRPPSANPEGSPPSFIEEEKH